MTKNIPTYIFLLTIILLSSCSVNKFIPEGDYLLDEVNILSNNKDIKTSQFNSYIRQNPNTKWFNLVKVPHTSIVYQEKILLRISTVFFRR